MILRRDTKVRVKYGIHKGKIVKVIGTMDDGRENGQISYVVSVEHLPYILFPYEIEKIDEESNDIR